jgi:hypothetical protein
MACVGYSRRQVSSDSLRLHRAGLANRSSPCYRQQQERDWVLAEFKSGRSPIMLATDVASRGLGMSFLLRFFPFPLVVESVQDVMLHGAVVY